MINIKPKLINMKKWLFLYKMKTIKLNQQSMINKPKKMKKNKF